MQDPLSRTVSALREQATPGSCTPKRLDRSRGGGASASCGVHHRNHLSNSHQKQHRNAAQNSSLGGDCLIYHFEEECVSTPIKEFASSYISPQVERKSNRSTNSIYTPSSLLKSLSSGYRCSSPGIIQTPQYTPAPSTAPPNTYERAICQKFDEEYTKALLEQEIGYKARLGSVRNITGSTLALFAVYLIIGCLYYSMWSTEAKWPLEESLVFLIYTVTTVGKMKLFYSHTISIPST